MKEVLVIGDNCTDVFVYGKDALALLKRRR